MSTRFLRHLSWGATVCSLLLTAGRAAGAEGDWLDRSWQTEEGLLDNSVAGVAQTQDGYLWVGTPTGLARFDGLHFENFSLTNVIALPNHGIVTMIRRREGGLWLGMDRGAVVRLDGRSSRAYVAGLPDGTPCALAEDGGGEIWVAYRDGTIFRLQADRVVAVSSQPAVPTGENAYPGSLVADSRGRIWLAKAGQVALFRDGKFDPIHHFDSQPMQVAPARDGGIWVCSAFHLYKCRANGECQDFGAFHLRNHGDGISSLLEDRQGGVWIGTAFNGLYHYDAGGFQLIPTSHNSILSLIEDHEGNIWAGTYGGGLNQIRQRVVTLEDTDTGLPYNAVQSVCEDTNQAIWVVTQNGVLACQTAGKWNVIAPGKQWSGDATCVTADAAGRVWVGTRRGLYCWQNGAFTDWGDAGQLPGKTLHSLLVSRTGDLWIGQESPNAILVLHQGRLETYPILPDSRVIRAMAEDAAGNIWAGTSKGILVRVSGHQLTEVNLRADREPTSIRCLYTTTNGAVWIGYAGAGVGCLRADGHYFEINTEQGLADDYISHILADDQGWLWFGGNRGIFKVREQELEDFGAGRLTHVRSIHYGRSEGLVSAQGTFGDSPNALRSHDGRLWIPTRTALVVMNPARLHENSATPPTLITRVTTDDRTAAWYNGIVPAAGGFAPGFDLAAPTTGLKLPPGPRVVEFEFSALGFAASENIQFRYRLTGLGDDWIEAGTVRKATYQRLQSGRYVFELTACNSDGEWNKVPTRLALEIAPFFWQRWWFLLAVLAAFTASLTMVVRYVSFRRLRSTLHQLEQQAALQRERTRIAKDIHDDLGASLTQIAFLGELANQDRGEPQLVGERMGKISTTARQAVKALDEIVWAVNPRNDTLAHLLDYSGQYAVDYLRLGGIRCRLDFPEQIPARELSTDLRHNLFLVIKEALHNIFKHAGATEVRVRVLLGAPGLEIVIEDNGRGFTAAPDDALADGLRNMKQRMTEIGGTFEVASQPGQGTRISARLAWRDPD